MTANILELYDVTCGVDPERVDEQVHITEMLESLDEVFAIEEILSAPGIDAVSIDPAISPGSHGMPEGAAAIAGYVEQMCVATGRYNKDVTLRYNTLEKIAVQRAAGSRIVHAPAGGEVLRSDCGDLITRARGAE